MRAPEGEDVPRRAWHSIAQNVHHDEPRCAEGAGVRPDLLREGTGGKPLCRRCAMLRDQPPPSGLPRD